MKKYFLALAYIGVFELQLIGCFDSENEANEALEENLQKQLWDINEEDREAFEETFWYDSRIEVIKDKINLVIKLLENQCIDADLVSPNFVKDFAANKKISLTSDEIVFISDNFKNEKE